MPCNSIAIAKSEIPVLVPWMLAQMTDPDLATGVLLTVAKYIGVELDMWADMDRKVETGWTGLRAKSLGKTIVPPEQALTIYNGTIPWAQVWLYPNGDIYVIDIPAIGKTEMERLTDGVTRALNEAAAQVLASRVSGKLKTAGFAAEKVADPGSEYLALVNFSKEVY